MGPSLFVTSRETLPRRPAGPDAQPELKRQDGATGRSVTFPRLMVVQGRYSHTGNCAGGRPTASPIPRQPLLIVTGESQRAHRTPGKPTGAAGLWEGWRRPPRLMAGRRGAICRRLPILQWPNATAGKNRVQGNEDANALAKRPGPGMPPRSGATGSQPRSRPRL